MDPNIDKELQEAYSQTVPEKLQNIRDCIEAIKQHVDDETLSAMRNCVHKIAGSAGTYGYTEVSQECRSMEECIVDALEHPDHARPQWDEELEGFYKKVEDHFKKKH
ncbi:MAG: hypothetical protein S4CHLAM102_15880 [Chlamydiia bacterium]|nr:hypothetical protein [Chlamydiia bacterium]